MSRNQSKTLKNETFGDYEDYKLRIFLLTLVDGHEHSFIDIRRAIKQEFYQRDLTGIKIRKIVDKLVRFECISRQKQEMRDEGNCIYMYTITRRGRERLVYYKKKLKEREKQ